MTREEFLLGFVEGVAKGNLSSWDPLYEIGRNWPYDLEEFYRKVAEKVFEKAKEYPAPATTVEVQQAIEKASEELDKTLRVEFSCIGGFIWDYEGHKSTRIADFDGCNPIPALESLVKAKRESKEAEEQIERLQAEVRSLAAQAAEQEGRAARAKANADHAAGKHIRLVEVLAAKEKELDALVGDMMPS